MAPQGIYTYISVMDLPTVLYITYIMALLWCALGQRLMYVSPTAMLEGRLILMCSCYLGDRAGE